MRRLLVPLLALALTAVGAPSAQAANGTLVLTWRWPAEATVSLPRGVALRESPTIKTDGTYALVAISRRGTTYLGMSWLADQERAWQIRGGRPMPGGAVTIRAIGEGPATVRLPVTGLSGTRTIRLDRRLRDMSVTVREFDRDAVDVVEDVIPFTLPRHSLLLHAVTRPGLRVASVEGICTGPRGWSCGFGVEKDPLRPAEWVVLHVDFGPAGWEGDAYAFFSDVMLFAEPAKHYLIWLSTA